VTATPFEDRGRDSQEIEALVTDRYLESIFAAHARGADIGPILVDLRPDPLVRRTAARLARDLPRFHPSFRFEEALAAKLQDTAARMRLPLAAGGEGDVVAVRTLPFDPGDPDRPFLGDARPVLGRPLLVGGALTSAAISIAGAVYVAWRFRRPQSSAMARAVRAVARSRLA
jgi:hypothetical protein